MTRLPQWPLRFLADRRTHSPRRRRGFTLVEVLTVVVIITILASITIGVTSIVMTKQTMARAESEMDMIMLHLSEFNAMYGEFPPMDNDNGSGTPAAEQNLLQALTGHARWLRDPNSGLYKWETVSMAQQMDNGTTLPYGEKYDWGHAFVETSKFKNIDGDTTTLTGIKDGAVIHDPWWDGNINDNAYLYRYKTRQDVQNPANRNWQTNSPVLVSRGPDCLPDQADENFLWKSLNNKSQLSGELTDDYNDPSTNPNLADNLVRSADKNLP
ncbi:MAG TPA: prepilin-type N-terminal cleavage/methylation domain-containing protein [Opitutales bacterium]|jgi:prepilin-type N-terminal cleavage/methylation domain-containing protein|nr:prepilin-type N-terminal cleavage/methylation domain-containing protein [Opitutales bacterium]